VNGTTAIDSRRGEEGCTCGRVNDFCEQMEKGSEFQNHSSRVRRKFDRTSCVRDLRRRGPASNQPRNIHLQHKPETETYVTAEDFKKSDEDE